MPGTQKKLKDGLSRTFRKIKKQKDVYINLHQDIFDVWKKYHPETRSYVSDLKSAMRYRHWLAHGRYWKAKLGQEYDFIQLYKLSEEIMVRLPLEGSSQNN